MIRTYAIDCEESTWEKVLEESYSELPQNGCVTKGYYESIVTREKQYPTALRFEMPVAIPHTNAEFTIIPSICIVRLKNPVIFYSMEDAKTPVGVQYVFNLALSNGDDQVKMLKTLMKILQDRQWMEEGKTMSVLQFKEQFDERLKLSEK